MRLACTCILLLASLAVVFAYNGSAAPVAQAPRSASKGTDDATLLAPGYGVLEFTPPVPGTYALPRISQAADGAVLDSAGQAIRLHQLFGDKRVLLSFIYATCSDVNGCPLATAVFYKIKHKLLKESAIASKLRLISLSFDPLHDTPDVMNNYGKGLRGEGIDWRFLTTRTETDLQHILSAYGQTRRKDYGPDGRFLGTFSHVLRVYLIDPQRQIRNIYSVSFLHADTLVNDVKTLLLEQDAVADSASISDEASVVSAQRGPQRLSLALKERVGKEANLMRWIEAPPLGLPPVSMPDTNPVTLEKIALGRKLFYDRRLSLNGTFSCAMCHIPEQGFSSQELATAVGIEGRTVRRNTPTLYNVAYLTHLFHDGREHALEQQIWGPLLAVNEMGNPSVGFVLERIKSLADYEGLFEQAFEREVSMETLGMAIASYERSLNSANSAFDRWYYGGEEDALSRAAQHGFELFTGVARCASCHSIQSKDALFTDNAFHNTGIGYQEAMQKDPPRRRVQIAPGVAIDVDTAIIASVAEQKPSDLGRYEITLDPKDRWKYRTPSLRNITLTAPYMHNGSLASLEDVVRFYNSGGTPNLDLDPLIKPLNLSDRDVHDLVAFLEALTGDNVNELVSDAFATPVGDLR